MIRLKSILLWLFLCLPLVAHATYEKSEKYRFHLWIPDRCETEWRGDLRPHFWAAADDLFVEVNVYTPQKDGSHYNYRTSILGNSVFEDPENYYTQKAEPWYNLLRHSRIAIRKLGENSYEANRLVFRMNTFFWVKVECDSTSLKEATEIVDSFNSECNTWSYFKIMRTNLTWYMGTIYLTFLPLFGSLAASSRKRWKRSAKKDRSALFLSVASIVATVALLGLMAFCLKDCPKLAIIIGLCSVGIWLCFFFGIKFVQNFFNGYFS